MSKQAVFFILVLLTSFGCKDENTDELPLSGEVQMSASSFLPQTLTVTAGTAVRWVNSSQADHTVTSSEGFFDRQLSPGDAFVYTFTTTGSYSYVCTIHAGMSGVIIVE